jgi:hypothetical protein
MNLIIGVKLLAKDKELLNSITASLIEFIVIIFVIIAMNMTKGELQMNSI